jgi:Polyketide cyclase / dehydrase and lipid transport
MTQSLGVVWPPRYDPSNCPVHVRNELDKAASQQVVWDWLMRATLWPCWYANSRNVKILDATGRNLKRGTRFGCTTFNLPITSTVFEYCPPHRIAWDAHGVGLDAYHAWVLEPSSKGCHVLTEETQHGWAARLNATFCPGRMSKRHQSWLEGLETRARAN